jgi:hypothetical protein
MRASISSAAALMLLVSVGCDSNELGVAGDYVRAGTWGGEDVSVQVEQEDVHVHVGCTNGDFRAPIQLDANGRFSVEGSYVLRAYPIQLGPSLPAQFAGVVHGNRLTVTVAVNDTVEKKLVILGPHSVTFGRQPRMGPCPICKPGEDSRRTKVPNAQRTTQSRTRSAEQS